MGYIIMGYGLRVPSNYSLYITFTLSPDEDLAIGVITELECGYRNRSDAHYDPGVASWRRWYPVAAE